jgi:hypothetical protein
MYVSRELTCDVFQPCLAALIFNAIVQKRRDGEILVTTVLQDGRSNR